MRWIDEQKDLEGKVVLVRASLNSPIKDGVVVDDFRIRAAIPTLTFLQQQGARIIVIGHVGRELDATLEPIARKLNEYIPVTFTNRKELSIEDSNNGDVVLLENLRQDSREITNDDSLAQELAALADIFVQDAFSVCHREHASVTGIPKYIESYGGLLLKAEVSVLKQALTPEHPALFVLGGAKFKTKEPLIRTFLETYDTVFVGGALQNEILAARGKKIGSSVIEDGIISNDILIHEKLQEVFDVVVEHHDGTSANVKVDDVAATDTIVDIGENTVRALSEQLSSYKTILWNGPLGWYEKGYDKATMHLAHAVAQSSAKTIIGGGDTVAVVQREGLESEFDFVSTGGGAMLEFLQEGTLSGLQALEN